MKCDQESAGYCKAKIAYNKYIKDNFCEECCDYCSHEEYCEDVCKIVEGGEQWGMKCSES